MPDLLTQTLGPQTQVFGAAHLQDKHSYLLSCLPEFLRQGLLLRVELTGYLATLAGQLVAGLGLLCPP